MTSAVMRVRYGVCNVYLFEHRVLVEPKMSDQSRTWSPTGWYALLSSDVSNAEIGEVVESALTQVRPTGFSHVEGQVVLGRASSPKLLGVASEGAVIASGSSAVVSRRDSQTNVRSHMKSGPRSGWFRRPEDHRELLETPDARTLGAAVRGALQASTFVPGQPPSHT